MKNLHFEKWDNHSSTNQILIHTCALIIFSIRKRRTIRSTMTNQGNERNFAEFQSHSYKCFLSKVCKQSKLWRNLFRENMLKISHSSCVFAKQITSWVIGDFHCQVENVGDSISVIQTRLFINNPGNWKIEKRFCRSMSKLLRIGLYKHFWMWNVHWKLQVSLFRFPVLKSKNETDAKSAVILRILVVHFWISHDLFKYVMYIFVYVIRRRDWIWIRLFANRLLFFIIILCS